MGGHWSRRSLTNVRDDWLCILFQALPVARFEQIASNAAAAPTSFLPNSQEYSTVPAVEENDKFMEMFRKFGLKDGLLDGLLDREKIIDDSIEMD